MKGDVPAPALRLLAQLPVRTHTAPDPVTRQYGRPGKGTRANTDQFGSKAVLFRGVVYASVTDALKELRVGYRTLANWIDRGQAEYVEAPQKQRRTA